MYYNYYFQPFKHKKIMQSEIISKCDLSLDICRDTINMIDKEIVHLIKQLGSNFEKVLRWNAFLDKKIIQLMNHYSWNFEEILCWQTKEDKPSSRTEKIAHDLFIIRNQVAICVVRNKQRNKKPWDAKIETFVESVEKAKLKDIAAFAEEIDLDSKETTKALQLIMNRSKNIQQMYLDVVEK